MSSVLAREYPPITQEQLKRYAEASGDPNPIHLDEEAARKVGLPGVIAHGMLISGFLAEAAREHMAAAESGWSLVSFQTRFRAMTRLGEVVLVSGVEKAPGSSERVIELEARNSEGEVKASGIARFSRRS